MRCFVVLLLLVVGSFVLPACAQKATSPKEATKKPGKKVAPQPAGAPAGKEAGPVLTFERTACYGTCPTYSMQVFADGRVAYEGRRFVPMLGKQDLRLPAAAVAELLRTVQEARFDQFKDRYTQGAPDLPTTIVAVRQPNGQLKTVTIESGAPDHVETLAIYLGTRFDALAQLGAAPGK